MNGNEKSMWREDVARRSGGGHGIAAQRCQRAVGTVLKTDLGKLTALFLHRACEAMLNCGLRSIGRGGACPSLYLEITHHPPPCFPGPLISSEPWALLQPSH